MRVQHSVRRVDHRHRIRCRPRRLPDRILGLRQEQAAGPVVNHLPGMVPTCRWTVQVLNFIDLLIDFD